MPKNILIYGCDFFSARKTSEINFWNDLVDRLAEYVDELAILSVNNRSIEEEKIADNVYLYNVKPHFLGNTGTWKDPEYSGRRFQRMAEVSPMV